MAFISLVVLLVFILAAISAMVLVFAGTFVLQGFLSNMKNPWVGLILPGISFCVILCLSILIHDLPTALALMSRGNICTAIYLIIYFFFRRRKKKLYLASQMKNEKL